MWPPLRALHDRVEAGAADLGPGRDHQIGEGMVPARDRLAVAEVVMASCLAEAAALGRGWRAVHGLTPASRPDPLRRPLLGESRGPFTGVLAGPDFAEFRVVHRPSRVVPG